MVGAAIPAAAQGKPIELWWQDEARVGQQGSLTRIWAERGSRPTALRDQRYKWAYLFGAVCPARGVGSGLVLPHANIEAMNLHLQQISSQVSQGAFAVLTLDGAGWHRIGKRLVLPDNVGLLHLPPYSPELNPVENIWEFLRQNELSNRVYRRCLLRRLEQTHRSTRADPIHRHARLCQNGRRMSRLVSEPVVALS